MISDLTNGQIGNLEDVIRTEDKKIEILIVKLKDENAGKNNIRQHPNLSQKYPNCVFIRRISIQYSNRKRSGDVGSMATVIQFPVRLAHAITAHKIQGNTIPYPSTVLIDLSSVFEPAQAYVMLSRVQCIDQVLIYKKLDEKKIRTSQVGLEELQRLQKISLNQNPTAWNKGTQDIRVAFLNCAGKVKKSESGLVWISFRSVKTSTFFNFFQFYGSGCASTGVLLSPMSRNHPLQGRRQNHFQSSREERAQGILRP